MADNEASKYHCNYCLADCSGLRVKCAECPDFDLCLQCFSSGAEMGEHKREHSYQLMDNGTFTIVSGEWSADEELLLLDAVEQHGFGNWDDIADHIGTKTPQEAQKHYVDFYLDRNIGKVSLPRELADIPDHTTEDDIAGGISLDNHDPISLPLAEQQELGYMPYRDDFEREFDNEAEGLIKGLMCNRDDDELDASLKLAQVDMYWRVVRERQRRKNIARDYGLVTSKHKLIASRRKLSKEDREFKDQIRIFAQLVPASEWEEILNGLLREQELKLRLKDLGKYRKNGIKKLAACQEYDQLRFKRARKKENKRRMMTSPPRTTKVSSKKELTEEDKPSTEQPEPFSRELEFKESMKNDTCYQLLSEKERQFCCATKMKCSRFVTLKSLILKEFLLRQQGMQWKTRYPPYVTKSIKRAVSDFLSQLGWIS